MIFLSYNRRDRGLILEIRSALERAGFKTFLDDDLHLDPRLWPEALEGRLATATAVVVFVGSNGLGPWQKRETYISLAHQAERERCGESLRVIPALLPGADVTVSFLFLNTTVDLTHCTQTSVEIDNLVRALSGTCQPSSKLKLVCPYRGLQEFNEEHAGLYFGREDLVEQCLRRLESRSLIGVVGPSGSGKSSFVLAGVVPRLRRYTPPRMTWEILHFTPGGAPWRMFADSFADLLPQENAADLAKDLSNPGGVESAIKRVLRQSKGSTHLLVVVDQFEELFTLAPEDCREPFIRALLGALHSGNMKIVLTVRADYYGRAIQSSRELSDLLMDGQVNLGPLNEAEIHEVIQKPADRVGVRFEPGLVDLIASEVLSQPGNLPLLEFVLTELWNRCHEQGLITAAAYVEVGGVVRAIQKRADELYASFDHDQQRTAQEMMKRLVHVAGVGDEGADTRTRVARHLFDARSWPLIEKLAGKEVRLLVISYDAETDSEQAEFAHEAIIRHWPQLRKWVDSDRQFLLWRQEISVLAAVWSTSGYQTDALLPRAKLQEAQYWWKKRKDAFNAPERAFIQTSLRTRRVHRVLVRAAVGAVAVVALVISSVLIYRRTAYYHIGQIRRELRQMAVDTGNWRIQENYIIALAALGSVSDAEQTAVNLPTPRLQFMGLSVAAQWALKTSGPNDTSLLRALLARSHNFAPRNRAAAVIHCFSILPKWGRSEGSVDLSRVFLDASDDIENPAQRVDEMMTLADLYPDRSTFFRRTVDAAAKITEPKLRLQAFMRVVDSLPNQESQTARRVSRLCDLTLAELPADSEAVRLGMTVARFKKRIGDDAGASQVLPQLANRLRTEPDSATKRDSFSSLISYRAVWTAEQMGKLTAESNRLIRKFQPPISTPKGTTVVEWSVNQLSRLPIATMSPDVEFATPVDMGLDFDPKKVHGDMHRTVFDAIQIGEKLAEVGSVTDVITYAKESEDPFHVLLAAARVTGHKQPPTGFIELVDAAHSSINQKEEIDKVSELLLIAKLAKDCGFNADGFYNEALIAARTALAPEDAAEILGEIAGQAQPQRRGGLLQEALASARNVDAPEDRAAAFAQISRSLMSVDAKSANGIAEEARRTALLIEDEEDRWKALLSVARLLSRGEARRLALTTLLQAESVVQNSSYDIQHTAMPQIAVAMAENGSFAEARAVAQLSGTNLSGVDACIAIEYAKAHNPILKRYLEIDDEDEEPELIEPDT